MNDIVISINSKYSKWLSDRDLSIEEIFVLKVFKSEDLSILQEYLSSKNSDQKIVYLQKLIRKGLLVNLVDINDFSWDNYELSEDGQKILDYLEDIQVIKTVELVNFVSTEDLTGFADKNVIREEKDKEKETQFDKFVEEFRNKFPEGKNGGGVSFRGNPIDVKNKLHKFMNKYKVDKEIILKATDLYIAGFRKKGTFEFCQAAEYFIMKNQTSTLAGYCELVKNNKSTGGEIVNPFEQSM